MSRRSSVHLVLTAWLGLCGAGVWQLAEHATTPGAVGAVPQRLPEDVRAALRWSGERPLLVVAAHPQCPCLPSTFDELSAVLQDERDVDLRVLAFEPSDPPAEWDPTARDTLCEGLPEGTVVVDRDGHLAEALGAKTSGHVSLYAPVGQLVFTGGITAGRGHGGANSASRALRRLLHSVPDHPTRTAVFGCPMCEQTTEEGS